MDDSKDKVIELRLSNAQVALIASVIAGAGYTETVDDRREKYYKWLELMEE